MHEYLNRNLGVLTVDEQTVVGRTRLLIAGCGLGSVVSELALRTGFVSQTIADGDVVEVSNLNRQAFEAGDVGLKKTQGLERRLRSIHRDTSLSVVDRFLTVGDVAIVGVADIVIESLDLSALDVIIAVHRAAREQGKPVISPLNIGFGTAVFVFTRDSMTAEDFYGIDPDLSHREITGMSLTEDILPRWASIVAPHLPTYLASRFSEFMDRVQQEGWCPVPQVGVGAYLSAAQVVTCAVQLALGHDVRLAPEPIQLDAWDRSVKWR